MTALTHSVTGHRITTDDESVAFWEAAGYRAEKAKAVHDAVLRNIDELRRIKPDKLVRKRREKYLKMGAFEE